MLVLLVLLVLLVVLPVAVMVSAVAFARRQGSGRQELPPAEASALILHELLLPRQCLLLCNGVVQGQEVRQDVWPVPQQS